jgi:hypothetical protein
VVDVVIDEGTGLPRLPDGQYWRVSRGRLRVEVWERGVERLEFTTKRSARRWLNGVEGVCSFSLGWSRASRAWVLEVLFDREVVGYDLERPIGSFEELLRCCILLLDEVRLDHELAVRCLPKGAGGGGEG